MAPSITSKVVRKALLSFLQGLCDSDGSIEKKGVIPFCTISSGLKDDVKKILDKYGFDPKIRVDARGANPVYQIRFSGVRKNQMFKEKIGFKHPFKDSRLKTLC